MEKEEAIIAYIKAHPSSSSKEINEGLNGSISYATVKRRLEALYQKKYIVFDNAKNRRYSLAPTYSLFYPISLEEYYSKEIDERDILPGYNFIEADLYQSIQVCGRNLFLIDEFAGGGVYTYQSRNKCQ